MAQSMNDANLIAQHLQKRPFVRIFENSREKNNINALKLMCILDFHTEHSGLYAKIGQSSLPKLQSNLLQFREFHKFKYYNYRVDPRIRDRVLQCKFCELIGPYTYILTHMTINHNVHMGLKMCVYCKHKELNIHFNDRSIEMCYQRYLQRHEIVESTIDKNVCEIVGDFYRMLKVLSKQLNTYCSRDHRFTGHGHRRVEKLNDDYGNDFPREVTVFRQNNDTTLHSSSLDQEFKRIISILYGGNNASRLFMEPPSMVDDNVIEISDDDDDHSVEPTQSGQSSGGGQLQYPVST